MGKILGQKTIYRDGEYVAFPNLAYLPDGRVICAFRHAKERQKEYGAVTHVDPTAKDVFILSEDGGYSFDPALHTIISEEETSFQDPCINVLRDGRIIVTYFRWDLVPIGEGEKRWGERFRAFGRSLHGKYDCMSGGAGYSISDDNGRTWRRVRSLVIAGTEWRPAVRGNIIEMPEGYLLMPVYGAKRVGELSTSAVVRSDDRGESWYFYADCAFDPDYVKNYLEPNLFLTDSGILKMLIRTQTDFAKPGVEFDDTYLNLHMVDSKDGGKTWGEVYEIEDLWGSSPFHAYKLASGKVAVAYGYRRKPFGIRMKICNGELSDIGSAPEIILRDDAPNGDLGYPHILQLRDGTILVSYYISGEDGIRLIEGTYVKE